ncbi:lin-52 DREAM MuvB core complex component [Columba livia]|uniref:Lin-52 DREAM MuvB core complex component n=1 Tax=Columba livia TaxID=8932 RepID=A0A2I0MP39_COLLI|nr:lin-52 DREAM MuvB core complex component [Columba livia]
MNPRTSKEGVQSSCSRPSEANSSFASTALLVVEGDVLHTLVPRTAICCVGTQISSNLKTSNRRTQPSHAVKELPGRVF